jgi:5,10-methylenetetrahydrofolate reductase
MKSLRSADFLNKVPGIKVPKDLVRKMKDSKDPETQGMEIAAQIIKEIRPMCDGVHIMPVGNHENTKTILEMAELI